MRSTPSKLSSAITLSNGASVAERWMVSGMVPSAVRAGMIKPLSSITAIWRSEGVESIIMRVGAAMSMSISSGMSSVVIMKLFLATRSENSREMIMPMFECTVVWF